MLPSIAMKRTRLAISAIAGSFTEEAAKNYLKDTNKTADFIYTGTVRAAFESISSGQSDYGIIPIRNSNHGYVVEHLKVAADYTYRVVHMLSIPVRQYLLVLPGVGAEEITQITSQLPALTQTSVYLDKNWSNTPRHEYTDTALAARDLASGKLTRATAIIASRSAAELYKLDILAADIQTDKNNNTDFMVIGPHS